MPTDLARRLAALTLVAAALLAPAARARAQSVARLRRGARVRVTIRGADPARIAGTLVAIGGDSLRYIPDGDTTSRIVLLDRVARVDVGRGVHRHTLQGFVTGATIGAFTGLVAGYASGNDPKQAFLSMTRADKAGLLGAAFGVIGGGVGTIIGFAHRSEAWQPVARPYALMVLPAAGGVTLGMRLALRRGP